MEDYERNSNSPSHEEDSDVRKGPWTEEEDSILVNFVSIHGDARWNHIARSSGTKTCTYSRRDLYILYINILIIYSYMQGLRELVRVAD